MKALFTSRPMISIKYIHSDIVSFSLHTVLKLSTTSLLYWGQNNQVSLDFWEQVVPHPVTSCCIGVFFFFFFGKKYKESSRIIQLLMSKVGLQD